jgi:hypothetical protein
MSEDNSRRDLLLKGSALISGLVLASSLDASAQTPSSGGETIPETNAPDQGVKNEKGKSDVVKKVRH